MKRCTRSLFLMMLGIAMTAGGYPARSIAQGAKSDPAGSADLKAVYATPQDVTEGKRVAESACASCHGIDGISRIKDTPHVAGQRLGYLYMEMRVYQAGGRGNT